MNTYLKYGLFGVMIAIAAMKPDLASLQWRRLERFFARLAKRKLICCLTMGALVLIIRLALLPVWETPKPYIFDEFGYLLQADTFSSGRLTNPTHPLWEFFESPYILMKPSYTSKYAPGQGLVLAAGQKVVGDPWWGVWLSCGVLMATLCWALQGWLSPGWALFGSVLALKLCLFSYWMDSYWGGAVAAIGGALMLGAYPRVVAQGRLGYSWLLGLGAIILAITRMYEGLLFVIPILIMLLVKRVPVRVWMLSGAVAAIGAAFVLYYNFRVTGNPLALPYLEHQKQYGYAPYFNFQNLQPETVYRHENLFNLAHKWEFERWTESRGLLLVPVRGSAWYRALLELCGGSIMVAVFCLLLWPAWRHRQWTLPFACIGITVAGSLVETIYYAHYAAPAAAAIILVLVSCFQYLRTSQIGGAHAGRFLSRGIPAFTIVLLFASEAATLYRHEPYTSTKPANARKQLTEQMLRDTKGGQHVILVRYPPYVGDLTQAEWIYNRADIDGADVIWAHDMGNEENVKLREYFKGRSFWLMRPDVNPDQPEPYTFETPAQPLMSQ